MAEATNTPGGSTTAGSIEVGTAGAGAQLAGPGTGRETVAQPVDARADAVASYDVADFAVPTGREENWRFTPLNRLRGLHDGSAKADGDAVKVDVSAPAGVVVELIDRTDPRVGKAGKPVDRVAAQAFTAFEKAGLVSVPRDAVLTEPIRISVQGQGGTAYGHQVIELGAFAEALVVIEHTGDAVLAANVEY